MKNRRENGELVVEASLIVTLVVIFITILLYIGVVMYQQTLVYIMANQTASNLASVYSNTIKDPFTGYIDPDKVYQSVTYSNMKTDAYIDVIEQKTNIFAKYRLKSSRILSTGNSSVDVHLIQKPNELLKGQIIVTIRDKYDLPLVGIFGTDGLVEFEATGRADCVDYLEYLMGIDAVGDPEHSPIPSLPDSDTCLVTFFTDKYSGNFHATVPVLRGKSIITSNHYSHSQMPVEPRLNDMKFAGWVLEDGSPFVASKQIDENITVYGSWQCKITFNADGGSVSPTEQYVDYMKTTELPNSTLNGYSLVGWFTEKNGAGEEYISNTTPITKNVTLYAHWRCTHIGAMVNKGKIKEGNCQTRSVWKYTCSRCGYTENQNGDFGKHDYSGRCGKYHDLSKTEYYIKSHAEGYRTVKGECIICTVCGSPAPSRENGYPDATGTWVSRGGLLVSDGMICRGHIANGREEVDGNQYNNMKNLHTHG